MKIINPATEATIRDIEEDTTGSINEKFAARNSCVLYGCSFKTIAEPASFTDGFDSFLHAVARHKT